MKEIDDACVICGGDSKRRAWTGDFFENECPRCGRFEITPQAVVCERTPETCRMLAVWVRDRNRDRVVPRITSDMLRRMSASTTASIGQRTTTSRDVVPHSRPSSAGRARLRLWGWSQLTVYSSERSPGGVIRYCWRLLFGFSGNVYSTSPSRSKRRVTRFRPPETDRCPSPRAMVDFDMGLSTSSWSTRRSSEPSRDLVRTPAALSFASASGLPPTNSGSVSLPLAFSPDSGLVSGSRAGPQSNPGPSGSGRGNVTVTHSPETSITGSGTPCSRQPSRIRRIPDPMCSTTSMR